MFVEREIFLDENLGANYRKNAEVSYIYNISFSNITEEESANFYCRKVTHCFRDRLFVHFDLWLYLTSV